MSRNSDIDRRNFIKGTGALTAGLISLPFMNFGQTITNQEDNIYLIGPQEGYSPQIGTLLSTMTLMRSWVIDTVQELTIDQLDFQIDDKSNSIGAMLLHLAATERYYQLNTFDGLKWGTWTDEIKKEWNVASRLGEDGRKQIKGNEIEYYIDKLNLVREVTKKEFAKRDDNWIMKSEPFFSDKPTNNYCKWFHVCEHESNHRGQIKFVKKRLPIKGK